MRYIHRQSMSLERDEKSHEFYTDPRPEIKKHVITINGSGHPRGVEPDSRIFRAPEVLHQKAGRAGNDVSEESPDIESLQDALRIFSPFRDDDGVTLGAIDFECPDCDAVFSSSDELQQHYLTKYCPGAAVAVYMMTRDRLIMKGYRMEKRFIPLHSRSLRFYCRECEQPFAVDDGEVVPRHKDAPSFVTCTHCGNEYDASYQSTSKEMPDDSSVRDLQHGSHSRRPSSAQRSISGSVLAVPQSSEEPSITKKAKRMRDSWSFRKLQQKDEDELVAISFTGLYDLEQVHAPNGVFQQFQENPREPLGTLGSGALNRNGHDRIPVTNSKRVTSVCEDNCAENTQGDSDENSLENKPPLKPSATRRQSLFEKMFGRKVTKGLSRTISNSHSGKRLTKRADSVRFSVLSKPPDSSRSTTAMSDHIKADVNEQNGHVHNQRSTPNREPDQAISPNGSQGVFIHTQSLSGETIVYDASGRQRLLQMDEVAELLSQLNDELASVSTWGEIVTTRLRAESALRAGNLKTATMNFQGALEMLGEAPALGVDKLSRAAMLYSLGQAYRRMYMPTHSESCYLESLGLYKRSFGRDHFRNFAILQDLGALCERRARTSEATALYERAFAGRLKILGQNDPDTLNSMQDLASLKALLGDLDSALLLLENAVPALESVFGLLNEKTLHAMDKLSLLYQKAGQKKDSNVISTKAIPPCKTSFGLDGAMTTELIVRYFQTSDTFDFPAEIKDIVDQYRQSRDPNSLRVIHRLGRSYMEAGLNRDAAELFQALYEDFLMVKGPEAPETFDALSALCVSREHLDGIEQAIHSYKTLVDMARKTPEDHHSRKRIGYAEKRIKELNRRRDILAAERKDWGLQEAGRCGNCGDSTTFLCSTCRIARFCSETCHNQSLSTHRSYCLPSVSLRESKSLAVKPRSLSSIREQALAKIPPSAKVEDKTPNITANYTFYLDPRNFTTFRMKLNNATNTTILFSQDADIQYTTLTDSATPDATPSSPNQPQSQSQDQDEDQDEADGPEIHLQPNTETAPTTSTITLHLPPKKFHWTTPKTQDSTTYIPPSPSPISPTESQSQSQSSDPETKTTYLIISPGPKMLSNLAERRIQVRQGGGEGERFRDLEVPNPGLIEYAQGLLLAGYEGVGFMYVVEWEWKE